MSKLDQRARTELQADGYLVEKVEYFNHITKRMRDLFGFCDIIAVKNDEILLIQVTSGSHHANRVRKCKEHPNFKHIMHAPWTIQVWSYTKAKNGRYKPCRKETL